MPTLTTILADHPFFRDFDLHYLQMIARAAVCVQYERDTYLFYEGEPAENFYLIVSGKVALETYAAGRGIIPIETIEAGEALGWSWLFPPYRWHFSARSLEPVQVITLEGAYVRNMSEEDMTFGYHLVMRMVHIIMQRLQATRLQLLDMYYVQAEGE